jgi:hypothetical protein
MEARRDTASGLRAADPLLVFVIFLPIEVQI